MIGRRGFIGGLLALAAAPFAPKVAAAAPAESGGPWLKANVFGDRPPLTEAQFRAALPPHGLRGIVDDGTVMTTVYRSHSHETGRLAWIEDRTGPYVAYRPYHTPRWPARVQTAKGSR